MIHANMYIYAYACTRCLYITYGIPIYTHTYSTMFFNLILGGGFKYFLFSPLFGEDFQFD